MASSVFYLSGPHEVEDLHASGDDVLHSLLSDLAQDGGGDLAQDPLGWLGGARVRLGGQASLSLGGQSRQAGSRHGQCCHSLEEQREGEQRNEEGDNRDIQ